MTSDSLTEAKSNQESLQLLEEGTKSYLEALLAISEFQREVRARCRRCLLHYLNEYSAALGIEISKDGLTDHPTAQKAFRGTWANLGVKLPHFRTSTLYCESYFALYWGHEPGEDPWFGAYISMWFNTSEEFDQVRTAFQALKEQISPDFWLDEGSKEVSLNLTLTPPDITSLDRKLNELAAVWIELWKKFGGLKALASAQNPTVAESE